MTKHNPQAGFTIVELLVATAVFSTILLVMTFSIMQFSRSYYRGITASSTQTAARSIIDDVTQAIQFSGDDVKVTPDGKTICIGSRQYDVVPLTQLNGTPSSHGLYVTPRNGTCAASPFISGNSDPTKNSRELIGAGMRVAKFSVTPMTDSIYTVNVKIVNGDNDLLCSPSSNSSGVNDCVSNKSDSQHDGFVTTKSDIKCRPITGSQFCSVAELNVSVQKRIN